MKPYACPDIYCSEYKTVSVKLTYTKRKFPIINVRCKMTKGLQNIDKLYFRKALLQMPKNEKSPVLWSFITSVVFSVSQEILHYCCTEMLSYKIFSQSLTYK
jgi:hypothetical protein